MLFAVGVLEAYRGQKIARALVNEAIRYARTHGAEVIALSADEEVSGLYRKCGFEVAMSENRWL
jgi:ribosomal protein S18 acetylase RimI-like enzyme